VTIRRAHLVFALVIACSGDDDAAPSDASSSGGGDTTSSTGLGEGSGSEASSSGGPVVPPLGPWRVMTFNVMCESCTPEGFDAWATRVPFLGDTIVRHDPDLLGLQELFSAENVDELLAVAPGYTEIWFTAPTPDDLDYADATIFYRTGMFEEVEHGFYWLSPEPDVPYSNGFSAPQLPRLVTWARLHATAEDTDILFATTHFDNGSPSQELSAPLVLERTAGLASELPVVMVGDYNSQPTDLAYTILTEGVDGAGPRFDDAFVLAADWRAETNLDPAPRYDPGMRIDHIFVAGAPWIASDWVVDQWGYGDAMRYTSDHFAIAIELAVR
jgi:endonuclease/exonuclease/phosphatase family metal-dependent hydrolase